MTSYISSPVQSTTSTFGRWTGISDFKIAAGNFMNHQYKACAVHALVGSAKVAMVFGTLYAAIQLFRNSTSVSLAQEQVQIEEAFCCDNLLQKGFNEWAYCLDFGKGYDPRWIEVSVPSLDLSKYSIEHSSQNYCYVRLTEAGRKLFSLITNCRELCMVQSKHFSLYGVCRTYS
jgi:hypothetical protein